MPVAGRSIRRFSLFILMAGVAACLGDNAADAQSPTQTTAGTNATPVAHPLQKAITIASRSREAASQLTDYTATLYRNMWLGSKYSESTTELKHRVEPFSVYLKFRSPDAGREVLFIEGWNNNKIYAHAGSGPLSYLGSLSLDPNGAQAMEGNKYPITNIGLHQLVSMLIEKWEVQMQFQTPEDVKVNLYPTAQLGSTPCKCVETTFARPHPQIPFSKARLFLTRDTNLPFAVQVFAFPQQQGMEAPKVEDVRYQNLKTNVGLTAQDFDYKNAAYSF